MRLIFASLIVALISISYLVEGMGLPLVLGLSQVRLLVLLLASLWTVFEAVSAVKRLSKAEESILQAKLIQDAARSEATQARDEMSHLKKQLETRRSERGREALQILSLLQEKGRFLDFVMDDVTKYPDAQIGAAARVVHQGCAAVMREYFDVKPVSDGVEGGMVTLGKDFDPQKFRLLGRVVGEPPFSGRVMHRGWLTTHVKLPELVMTSEDAPNREILAPAEIELS